MRLRHQDSQRGFVIAIAMVSIMTISFLSITTAMTIRSTTKVAGNYTKTIGVFNIAEAGIARARPLIEGSDFDTLLTTYSSTPIVPSQAFNNGTYEVTITDNDDGDSDLTDDSDGIIIVNSIGTSTSGGSVEIQTYLQEITNISTPGDPPGGPTSALLCGADSQTGTQGSASFEGCDYNLPTLPCTGSGCDGTLVGDNDSSGDCSEGDTGGYAAAAEHSLTTSGSGYTSANASSTVNGVGSDSNCDDWLTLKNQLASLPAGTPGVTVWTGSEINGYDNCSSGSPGVHIINSTSSVFKIKGSTCIQGMIVVASSTSIEATGTTTIVGITMVSGASAGKANIDASSGTANMFGEFITFDTVSDPDDEIYLKGNANVKFSTAAKSIAEQAMSNAGVGGGGALLTVSWEEKY